MSPLTCGHRLSIWVAAIRTNFTPSSLLEMEQARLATWGEKKNREHEMETMSTVCRGLGLEMEGWNWNVSLKQERCWAVFWALKCHWARHRTPKMLTVTVQRNLFTLVPLPLGLLVHNASVKIVIAQLGLIKTSFPFTSFYLKVTRSFYHLASALALWLGILL